MRCRPGRHIKPWLLVSATVVLVSALLVCFANRAAMPQVPHQAQYCCLVAPVNQPSTALFALQGLPERLPALPRPSLVLPTNPGLPAGWALWERWRRVASIRPLRRYDRSGLAPRAPPYMPRSFSFFNL